jgi:predicted transcriptional regulator
VVDCEKLRLICPMAAGNHSLDDLHEVLTQMESGIEQLNETQERIATRADTRDDRLTDVLSALRLELARKKE